MTWLRDPLLPFLAIALVLLAWQEPEQDLGHTIDFTAEVQAGLKADFQRQRNRPPNAQEIKGLEQAWIEQEVLSREARRLGLDQNDPVVRRRLAQAMRFLLENGLPPKPADSAAILDHLEANKAQYELPRRLRFVQLFFSHDKRGDQAETKAGELLSQLMTQEGRGSTISPMGDPFIHGRFFGPVDQAAVAKRFGNDFAQSLFQLKEGPRWQGPLRSSYGYHLIRLVEDLPAGLPSEALLKSQIQRDLSKDASRTQSRTRIKALMERYEIRR